MSVHTISAPTCKITPTPPPETHIEIKSSPLALVVAGANIAVSITAVPDHSEAFAYRLPTIQTVGHIDTGATLTSIDISLAKTLGLGQTGYILTQTAGGPQRMPTYVIDLTFPLVGLQPLYSIKIGSCQLGYKINEKPSVKNFGILIGRDVMSRWHITWNGPTSTVTICD